MKRTLMCAALLLPLLAQEAVADRPAPFSWTGFYVGAGGGAGAVLQSQTENVPGFGTVFSESAGAASYFGTVTAGYDHRVMPRVVVGALFDYEIARIAFDNPELSFASLPFDRARTWSAGVRAGYLVNPTTLLYVSGGYTRTSMDFDLFGTVDFSGYFVGGGVETQLMGNWLLRGEYRFADYRREVVADCGCGATLDVEPSMHTGRVLLIYKFGSGAGSP
jgi:outer membrane immunogenic protein